MESQLGTLYQYQAERDDHDDDACDKHGSCKDAPDAQSRLGMQQHVGAGGHQNGHHDCACGTCKRHGDAKVARAQRDASAHDDEERCQDERQGLAHEHAASRRIEPPLHGTRRASRAQPSRLDERDE